MADITISAVSTVYTGTDGNDSFRNTVGNPTDIGVLALSGNDIVTFGSATQSGTGAGGIGLGFGLASSDIQLGDGNDTFTFSGQIGSGAPRFNVNNLAGGTGEDYIRVNNVLSASGSVLRGGIGNDQVYFIGNPTGGRVQTAFRMLLEGNAGDDQVTATWAGQAQNFEIYGGQGADSISASFNRVTSYGAATAYVSGVYVAGGKGNDEIRVNVSGTTAIDIVIAGNSGNDTIGYFQEAANGASEGGFIFGGQGNDAISAALLGSASGFQIQAGVGNDSASFTVGGSGNDIVLGGGSGNDNLNYTGLGSIDSATIRGGTGADTISAELGLATAGNFVVSGEAGNDLISVSAGVGSLVSTGTIDAGSGDDSVRLDLGGAVAGLGVFLRSGSDTLSAGFAGAVSGFTADGNTGTDVISISAAGTMTNSLIDGGHGNDTITATFLGDLQGVTVAGGLGNDSATISIAAAGVSASAVAFNGQSGNDSLNFQVVEGATFFAGNGSGGNNTIAGGSGSDTITLTLGGAISASGVSALLVSLGEEATGGQLNLNIGTAGQLTQTRVTAGEAVTFRGSTTGADDINFNVLGGGQLTGAVVSAEGGNDTFTLSAFGAVQRVIANAGDGNDSVTAVFQTGAISGNVFNLNTGADSLSFIIVSGEVINGGGTVGAFSADGGIGADTLNITLLSGGRAALTAGNQLVGGSDADNLGLIGATGSQFGGALVGGDGSDAITGNLATGSLLNGFTADGGAGADTISFVFSAAATAGITINGGIGAFFMGGSGADSINVVSQSVTGGAFNFGTIVGGSGVDSITFGGTFTNSAGEILRVTGSVNAGAGADSIVFSGNNAISGSIASFEGSNASGGRAFIFASGDSVIGSFDTIFVANSHNLGSGGRENLQGTFGSAGLLFTGFNEAQAGGFNMQVATGSTTTSEALTLGQAIFTGIGLASAATRVAMITGGLVGGVSASGASAENGAFVLTGGSTLGQIFSAVDALTVGRGKASVFNVQNGSAGSVDGYLFVQGGTLTDTIVKFNGNGVSAARFGVGEGYFSAGGANALASRRTQATSNSAGQIFFGGNVGVG